ncbi:MAG: hypothetical protein QMD96_01950 [Anaerosomatales bacterium]|nr:hypothetical protein [Anaerosomatales bacterium]
MKPWPWGSFRIVSPLPRDAVAAAVEAVTRPPFSLGDADSCLFVGTVSPDGFDLAPRVGFSRMGGVVVPRLVRFFLTASDGTVVVVSARPSAVSLVVLIAILFMGCGAPLLSSWDNFVGVVEGGPLA